MRHVRILAHREDAAERTSARTRSRSAELARSDGRALPSHRADKATRTQPHTQDAGQSPKRPRTLAPIQRAGLNLQREAQEFEEQREQSELSCALSSFALEGATRHGRSVELELSRIKDELSPQQDRARHRVALPHKGARVVLTGLVSGSNYNGREAEVVEIDGHERLLVHVCGASELCQLSVKLENVAVVGPPASRDLGYEAGRDFSQIHELATLHAQQNARREVQRLASEADERHRAMEHSMRADSLWGMNHSASGSDASVAMLHPVRQRCRHGNKCAKPDCMDLHPWEADWVQSGADSGCDSKSKLKAAKCIYNHLAPAPRVKSKTKRALPNKATCPTGSPDRGKDSQMAEAAVEIDRILAQAGVPVAARKAAHENVFPLLCSHKQARQILPAKQKATSHGPGQKLGHGRLGGVRSLGQHDQDSTTGLGGTQSEEAACRPRSLPELQSMQESLQRTLDGGVELLHGHQGATAADSVHSPITGHMMAGMSNPGLVEGDIELGHRPSWRDHEDPDSRIRRIMQLVEVKKAELRKKKLIQENTMLQEALGACGAVLSDSSSWPLRSTSVESDGEESQPEFTGPSARLGAERGRPRVVFENDPDVVFES